MGLLDGTITPRNEDPNSNLVVTTSEGKKVVANKVIKDVLLEDKVSAEPTNNEYTYLKNQKIVTDVHKVKTDGNVDTYEAIVAVQNTYATTLTQQDADETADVIVYGKISYQQIKVSTEYAQKILTVQGKYYQTDDPQMTCRDLWMRAKYMGDRYDSSGNSLNFGSGKKDSKVTAVPVKGSWYPFSTSQPYFIEEGSIYNAGRVYYKAVRTVSGYEADGYVSLGFGDIPEFI